MDGRSLALGDSISEPGRRLLVADDEYDLLAAMDELNDPMDVSAGAGTVTALDAEVLAWCRQLARYEGGAFALLR